MAIEKVREYFKGFGLDGKILEFDVSSATVELAAKALNVEGERIAKTLSFRGKDGSAFLVVSAGDAKIDNAKFKHTFLVKYKHLKLAIIHYLFLTYFLFFVFDNRLNSQFYIILV